MKDKFSIIVITLLRVVGTINSISLALYTFLTICAIVPFGEDLLEQAYIGVIMLTISALILILNIFLESKLYPKRGWIADSLAATLMIIMLIYFSYFIRPKILEWLMPLGAFLPTPILLSAITSFLLSRKRKNDELVSPTPPAEEST